MKSNPPYITVEPHIFGSSEFRSMSRDARDAYRVLLLYPEMSKVPGLILGVDRVSFCGQLQLGEAALIVVFDELIGNGFCEVDWDSQAVFVPAMLARMICNQPKGNAQAASFGRVIKEAPNCPLIDRVDTLLRSLMRGSVTLVASYLRTRQPAR